jgi:hypothetical protein
MLPNLGALSLSEPTGAGGNAANPPRSLYVAPGTPSFADLKANIESFINKATSFIGLFTTQAMADSDLNENAEFVRVRAKLHAYRRGARDVLSRFEFYKRTKRKVELTNLKNRLDMSIVSLWQETRDAIEKVTAEILEDARRARDQYRSKGYVDLVTNLNGNIRNVERTVAEKRSWSQIKALAQNLANLYNTIGNAAWVFTDRESAANHVDTTTEETRKVTRPLAQQIRRLMRVDRTWKMELNQERRPAGVPISDEDNHDPKELKIPTDTKTVTGDDINIWIDVFLYNKERGICVYIECKVLHGEQKFSLALGQVLRYELKNRNLLNGAGNENMPEKDMTCPKVIKIIALDREPSRHQKEEAWAFGVRCWWVGRELTEVLNPDVYTP